MRRDLFTEDHEAFRELARDFIEKEVVPAYPQWEKAGIAIWILCAATQEEYDKLFGPPNWRDYWRPSFAFKADVDGMIDELAREYEQSQASGQETK